MLLTNYIKKQGNVNNGLIRLISFFIVSIIYNTLNVTPPTLVPTYLSRIYFDVFAINALSVH